ncbi:LysE family translocator [Boseongicola sp. H5]|uniref:LysE family translocator n=1 Tax=Boseongicola sp. H5 TaxID=2763261 RepID=UPI001D0AC044|nr:LysE family translocator [Boseongicola sp. H5]
MTDNSQFVAFFLATLLFAWIPGPAMLYTTARTISQGKRAGCMSALGIHVGGYVHVASAALGLAIVFQAVPTLYLAVKLIGATYLCYLGIKLFRRSEPFTSPIKIATMKTEVATFWQSVTVEILNPKTVILFVAFLPQCSFTEPAIRRVREIDAQPEVGRAGQSCRPSFATQGSHLSNCENSRRFLRSAPTV